MKTTLVLGAVLLLCSTPVMAQGAKKSPGAVSVPSKRQAPGYLGIAYASGLSMSPGGEVRAADFPVITELYVGSPAVEAGLQLGDVILSVNGRDGRESALFGAMKPGTKYVIRVRRDEEIKEFTMLCVTRPAAPPPQIPPPRDPR